MFKPRPQFNDAKIVRHPVFAIKRKSESDDSDYRSSFESPTTHCYVAGTRPKRTLPRRALSTGGVEIKSAAMCMDVQSDGLLQTGLHKPHTTPPRSKSATSLRTFDRVDSVLPIPNLGTCRIHTLTPPSLLPFYETTRQSLDMKMDLVRSSSSRSITGKLNDMRIYLGVSYLTQKVVTCKSAESLNRSRPQVSLTTTSASERRASVYISDEDMHLCTSTEEDDSDLEAPVIRSLPSSASATFFRKIRLQEMLRNSQNDESVSTSARQVPNKYAPSDPPTKPVNLLQPSNYCIPPPTLIIDRCEVSDLPTRHRTKRVKLSRHGHTPPPYRLLVPAKH